MVFNFLKQILADGEALIKFDASRWLKFPQSNALLGVPFEALMP